MEVWMVEWLAVMMVQNLVEKTEILKAHMMVMQKVSKMENMKAQKWEFL